MKNKKLLKKFIKTFWLCHRNVGNGDVHPLDTWAIVGLSLNVPIEWIDSRNLGDFKILIRIIGFGEDEYPESEVEPVLKLLMEKVK